MARFLKLMVILVLGASPSLRSQPAFKATATTIATAEGGRQDILIIETDNKRFSLERPKGYGIRAQPGNRSVVFTSETGASVITMLFTTNYAGALPKQEVLRDEVAGKNPRASLVQSSTSYTDFGPAHTYDLFQPGSKGLMLHIRDAYVAYPEGSAELTFSCDAAEFDKQKLAFSRLLNSFRSLPEDAKKNP